MAIDLVQIRKLAEKREDENFSFRRFLKTECNLEPNKVDERVFEIAAVNPDHPLTEHKAKGVAEALRRQDMFDEISVEAREEED